MPDEKKVDLAIPGKQMKIELDPAVKQGEKKEKQLPEKKKSKGLRPITSGITGRPRKFESKSPRIKEMLFNLVIDAKIFDRLRERWSYKLPKNPSQVQIAKMEKIYAEMIDFLKRGVVPALDKKTEEYKESRAVVFKFGTGESKRFANEPKESEDVIDVVTEEAEEEQS